MPTESADEEAEAGVAAVDAPADAAATALADALLPLRLPLAVAESPVSMVLSDSAAAADGAAAGRCTMLSGQM